MSLQVFCVGVSSLPLAEGPMRDSDLNLLYCTLLHSYGSYQMGVGGGGGAIGHTICRYISNLLTFYSR